MRACKITQITMMRGQYYFNWNLRSLSVCSCSCEDSRVPPLNLLDISIAEDLHCSKAVDRSFVRMEGQRGRIRRFAIGPVYPSKSLTMCYSDFVFRKYKQESAFRVSGVLQLAKTGTPVTKNFPLLRLFPSGLKALHTLWRQPYQFAYFDRARNVAHFDSNWPTLQG